MQSPLSPELCLLDYNWKLPGVSQVVLDSNLPLDFFSFGSAARTSFPINPTSHFPLAPQAPFSSLGYQRQGSSSQTLGQMGVGLWSGGP